MYISTYTHIILITHTCDFLQLLFSELTKESNHMNKVEDFCDFLLTNSSIYTNKGLLYVSNKHTLSFAANAAFVCLLAASSDDFQSRFQYYNFAKKQIDYILGISTGKQKNKRKYHIVEHLRITKCKHKMQLKIVCIDFLFIIKNCFNFENRKKLRGRIRREFTNSTTSQSIFVSEFTAALRMAASRGR